MFDRILPRSLDNTYRAHRAALWLLGLVAGVKMVQSLSVIFNGYGTAVAADGIPLATYPREAAQQMLALFAQGSLWRLTFGLVCVVVLLRYRSAAPLMLLLLLLNYIAGQLIFHFVPLGRTGAPPGPYVNFGLFALTVVGLMLSLWTRTTRIQRQ